MSHSRDRDEAVDVVVIGAGLAGLATAASLHREGLRVQVLEAADRIGGRIGSVIHPTQGHWLGDLGPTWVWPGAQPVVVRWLESLGIRTLPQFHGGHDLWDPGEGSPRPVQLPVQEEMRRLDTHPQGLVDGLAKRLPSHGITRSAPVDSVSWHEESRQGSSDPRSCTVTTRAGQRFRCSHVVVAVPPRIAVDRIAWTPSLPDALAGALQQTSTWMAVQAKAVIGFDTPFWRNRGLSGRVVSAEGPLAEVHDHCGPEGKPAALFGFLSWPAPQRVAAGETLRDRVVAQLIRCFGEDAADPEVVHIEDWAQNDWVCGPRDLAEIPQHPRVAPESLRELHWQGRLQFVAAETATVSPGLIEGALHAAERAAAHLRGFRSSFPG